MLILSDVNLEEITFSVNGKNLLFKFINMFDGKIICTIKCKSVYLFNYQNAFSDDDGFACYVGEVKCEKIPYNFINEWLKLNNYGFTEMDSSTYLPTKNDLLHVHIEGGEVAIDLACEVIEKDNIRINVA